MNILNPINNSDKLIQKMQIMLPCGGSKDVKLLSKMKKHLKELLSEDIETIVTYQSREIIQFILVNVTCSGNYVGERNPRIEEGIVDHNNHNKNSLLLRHVHEMGHSHKWNKDLTIIRNNHCSTFNKKLTKMYL